MQLTFKIEINMADDMEFHAIRLISQALADVRRVESASVIGLLTEEQRVKHEEEHRKAIRRGWEVDKPILMDVLMRKTPEQKAAEKQSKSEAYKRWKAYKEQSIADFHQHRANKLMTPVK